MPGNWAYIAISATIIGIATSAFSVGRVFSSAVDGIAKNPGAEQKIMRCVYVGAGLIEALGLFCLVLALMMLF